MTRNLLPMATIVAMFALSAFIATLSDAVITVQIGGASRLSTLNRQRDRYSCFWDCDLVGCQIARDDDECAYDCEKICRVKYDYSARSAPKPLASASLEPKADQVAAPARQIGTNSVRVVSDGKPLSSAAEEEISKDAADVGKLLGAGTSVRLHLPRNASEKNFAIWERCSSDSASGEKLEMPFSI